MHIKQVVTDERRSGILTFLFASQVQPDPLSVGYPPYYTQPLSMRTVVALYGVRTKHGRPSLP